MPAPEDLSEILAALAAVGVTVGHKYEYRGEQGAGRYCVDLPDTVASVSLPFTAREWCAICMSEASCPEEHYESIYIGGCCGNTGLVQDIVNSAFRSGGLLSADELQTAGSMLRGHDGWEYFSGEFDVFEALQPERWEPTPLYNGYRDTSTLPARLDPWEKICVIHAALEPLLALERDEQPKERPVHPEVEAERPGTAVMSRLENSLRRTSWGDMLAPSLKQLAEADPATEHGQRQLDEASSHRLSRRLAFMRLLQPTRDLNALLDEMVATEEPIDGFAIVRRGSDEVLTSNRGLCVYGDRAAAERVLELWGRVETVDSSRARHGAEVHVPEFVDPSGIVELLPITVTVADGLVVRRD
jgi:hypothetical protein